MVVTQQMILMIAGVTIAGAGLVLLFIRNEQAQNKIKLFGQEFEISTPGLVVFLVGCVFFIIPLVIQLEGKFNINLPSSNVIQIFKEEEPPPVTLPEHEEPPSVTLPEHDESSPVTSLKYYGARKDSTTGKSLEEQLSEKFKSDTGITVYPRNPETEPRLPELKKALEAVARKPDSLATYDVVMIDHIWVKELAQHLIDLNQLFQKEKDQHDKEIIDNNTIKKDGNEKLVAIPFFKDVGLLYYRKDLLERYEQNVPVTWEDLEKVALKIQTEEQRNNNPTFIGFVWQGNNYEGLACNALEWIASRGGFDSKTNQISFDDQAVVEALDHARKWVNSVNSISSKAVLSYTENESLDYFSNGNAAFLRAWPSAYAQLQKNGRKAGEYFDVAPLPHAEDHKSVGVLGGWQLAIPKNAPNVQAAIKFIRYLTSQEVQAWRAHNGTYIPTISEARKEVKEKIDPLIEAIGNTQPITRPWLGANYEKASECIHDGVYQALRGTEEPTKYIISKMKNCYEKATTLDDQDRRLAAEAAQLVMETGYPRTWDNPDTGVSGQAEVVDTKTTQQTVAVPVLSEPYRARRNANVRDGPSMDYVIVGRLSQGETVMVAGKVKGQPWYMISQGDAGSGFVHADLLEPDPTAVAAAEKPAATVEVKAVPAARTCRIVRQKVTLADGSTHEEEVTACQNPNGWEIISGLTHEMAR